MPCQMLVRQRQKSAHGVPLSASIDSGVDQHEVDILHLERSFKRKLYLDKVTVFYIKSSRKQLSSSSSWMDNVLMRVIFLAGDLQITLASHYDQSAIMVAEIRLSMIFIKDAR